MKASMVRIFIVVLLFALGACSGEDQQPPQTPPPKVVQPIKPSTSTADIEKPTTTAAEEKKPQAAEKTQTEKPASAPDRPTVAPTPAPEEKKVASEEPTTAQAKKKDKEEPGTYLVKKGDTLSNTAARSDILKDPLKWTILLSLNKDKLGEWATGENLPDRELPQGTKLKVMTAKEARANLKKATAALWVVNVLSSTTSAEIVPPAVTLVKQGYPVYIVRANVKGKDYMRLRVGFFKNRIEADDVGKRIKEQLSFQDSWSTKADKEEYEEVAGFFKFIEKH
jgi:type IV secretory pathway VirB10-like protein